jgi:hypothetical protein
VSQQGATPVGRYYGRPEEDVPFVYYDNIVALCDTVCRTSESSHTVQCDRPPRQRYGNDGGGLAGARVCRPDQLQKEG